MEFKNGRNGVVMNRSDYWNDKFVKYWDSWINQPENSWINEKSQQKFRPSVFEALVDKINLNSDHTLLDAGCGFGQNLSFLKSQVHKIYAIDISIEMANRVRSNQCNDIKMLGVAEAERLPFISNFFDRIICFGVFDALNQKEALFEFSRILKLNGRLLITGKNYYYHQDDYEALEAEQNARDQGHPNFFTDCRKLLENLNRFGFVLNDIRFFSRRGDFSNYNYIDSSPSDPFYEYSMIVEKKNLDSYNEGSIEIAFEYSQTFLKKYSPS